MTVKLEEKQKSLREATTELRDSALKGMIELKKKHGFLDAEENSPHEYRLFTETIVACDIYLMGTDG